MRKAQDETRKHKMLERLKSKTLVSKVFCGRFMMWADVSSKWLWWKFYRSDK